MQAILREYFKNKSLTSSSIYFFLGDQGPYCLLIELFYNWVVVSAFNTIS